MELAVFWLGFAIAVGIWASKRGRSGFGWFLLAVFLSPLLAAIFLAVLGDLSTPQVSPDTHVKCPDCRELVLKDARKCKHCGCALVPQ